jgi:hypothetical protein
MTERKSNRCKLSNTLGLVNICLNCLLASTIALKCSANKCVSLYNVTHTKNDFSLILKVLQILGFFPSKSLQKICVGLKQCQLENT